MPTPQNVFTSIALTRLRRGVGFCCWVVALSLITQVLVFGIAAFMDVRHQVLEQQTTPATIVSAADAAREQPLASADAQPLESPVAAKSDAPEAVNPNVVLTKQDFIMGRISSLALTGGSIAIVLLIPMVMVGVMLSAASATPGVERVVSSFMWSLAVAVLVLPLGSQFGLPWDYGGLTPYDYMTEQVDRQMVEGRWGDATFHARFSGLPLFCLIGVGFVGFRFSNGVVAGILPKEDVRLDPTLEKEAANIKPGSLIGGRAASALRSVSPGPAAPHTPAVTAVTTNGASEVRPGMLQPTAGEAPKRLI
jgi:hypothetical protein